VECFDDTQSGGNGPSLLHIQGYSLASGTVQQPIAHKVTLTTPPGTCTDGYFSDATTNCTATISATIDYGSSNTSAITVKPVVGGTTESALTASSKSGTATTWTGTVSLQGPGSNQIDLAVTCNPKPSGSPCSSSKNNVTSTISDVQRSSAASTNTSGTIDGAWISETGSGGSIIQPQDADSFEVCESQDSNSCAHNLVVTADVGSSLQNTTSYSAPPYTALSAGRPSISDSGASVVRRITVASVE